VSSAARIWRRDHEIARFLNAGLDKRAAGGC